jgi:hypothetical protein
VEVCAFPPVARECHGGGFVREGEREGGKEGNNDEIRKERFT